MQLRLSRSTRTTNNRRNYSINTNEGERKYVGMKFTVLGRVKDIAEDKDGADLECLPMWNIQFENGDMMAAYPEEICLAER